MNDDTKTGQQKFREKMKAEGKSQRVFYLSDSAVLELKKKKIELQKSSLNAVVEGLIFDKQDRQLTQLPAQKFIEVEKVVEVEKIVKVEVEKLIYEMPVDQQRILEQAAEVSRYFKLWNSNQNSNIAGKNLSESCKKLSELIE